MPDVKPFPKPDLSKYPEIPAGACLNFNNRYGYYQVYKSFQKEDLSTGKKRQSRITYGSIGRDGFFLAHAELTIRTFSQTARNTRKRDSDPKLQTPFVDRTDPDKASRHLDILPVVMSEQKKISTACLPLSEQQPPDFTLSCSFC